MNKKSIAIFASSVVPIIFLLALVTGATSFESKGNSMGANGVVNVKNGTIVTYLNSPIVMKVGIEKTTISLGNTTEIPITFTYDKVNDQTRPITVLLGDKANQAILFTPSATTKYTQKEKQAFLTSSNLPSDAVNLYSLESFSKNTLTLMPGQTTTVDMFIHIPNSWPQEMIGQSIIFNVNHRFVPPLSIQPSGPISVEVVITK